MTKVAVVKADFYDSQVVDQAMQELLAPLGGIEKYINSGEQVLVKPNMLEAADQASGILSRWRLFEPLYGSKESRKNFGEYEKTPLT